MSNEPLDGSWWKASDGRWYPLEQWPADESAGGPVSAAAQGWWRASDGKWYSPELRATPPPIPAAHSPVPPILLEQCQPPQQTAPGGYIAPRADGAQLSVEVFGERDDTGFNTVVPSKVQRYFRKHSALLPGEVVRAVLGGGQQVLIATERRLLVVKVGWAAGSTGGGRTTAFNYADVTAIQIQLGFSMGSLSVQSPGYGATQTGDYWNNRNQQDPLTLPNVIVWSKALDKKFIRELNWVRSRVDQARDTHPVTISVPAAIDLAEQLAQLGQLHAAGMLTDKEFTAAKARLIAS